MTVQDAFSKPKWSVQFPKLQPQLLTTELVPHHTWAWLLPLPTNPGPMCVFFHRIFFFFTENSSSQVGAVLYERISVFIPHEDPLQEDKWVIIIYDTNWLLWKWLGNGQLVLPVNSPMDIISSRHTCTEAERYGTSLQVQVYKGHDWLTCALPAAEREWRQDARVLRPTLVH